jgi:CBS domain containing-hemolysin-like protein
MDALLRSVATLLHPEGTALTQQLLEFQRRERRMGLVVDEYGDIQGLVTLDDILEEIVGEYTTEGGTRQKMMRKQENGTWIIDGATTVAHAQPSTGLEPAHRRRQNPQRPDPGTTGIHSRTAAPACASAIRFLPSSIW